MKHLLLALAWISFAITVQAQSQSLGQQTYSITCAHCHSPAFSQALDAPAAFDSKAWGKRIQAAKQIAKTNPKYKTAYDYLLEQVKVGKNLMPHHGLCLESTNPNKNCTDQAYIEAIKFMAKSKD